MTGPIWDGRGTDPWMPQRLNALLEATEVERSIREEFWALLTEWLRGTRGRVLRSGAVPDPDAVYARIPAWGEAVEQLARGRIREAIGVAFERLLGPGYPWERRAFVTRYLADVRSRLADVPLEVGRRLDAALTLGINSGEGIPSLAERVQEIFSLTGTLHWSNRATVVARTEAIGALNAGRQDAFLAVAEETGDPLEKLWLATEDSRTRPTHQVADGQRVPVASPFIVGGFELRFPGDPLGPPQEVIQCRCTQLLVEPGEFVDFSDRQYRRRS